VVLLKVQMHPDQGFQHRLAAQSCRFLQKHPQVEHLEVVVITPTAGVSGGGALDQPGGLEKAARSRPPAPLAHTAGRPESELAASSRQIVASRPDLKTIVLPMVAQRFPDFSAEQIMP
jgi:hypothetical protein